MKIFTEKLHAQYSQVFKLSKIVVKEKSSYQKILIFDNEVFGRVLALDDIIQITEKDHHAYTEMLVHFPIIANKSIRKVLIIGGGDGAIASEILKHGQIEKIVLCEIDKRVIDLSKKYLRKINFNSLTNPKINIVIDDAANYINSDLTKGYFDLIIVDRPDPIGPGNKLFKINFYKDLKNIISKKGTIVFQTGVPFFQKKELKETSKKLNSIFRYSGTYHTVVPTYIGGHMTLSWASDAKNLNKKINIREANIYLKKIITNYYTPEIHNSSLDLPLWIQKLSEFI